MTARSSRLLERAAGLPMISSGLSLASSTVITAGLGFFFWILASRIYVDEAKFGVGATAISTMMMLADLACVGMRTGLVKFVPTLGDMRRRVIGQSYAIAFLVATSVAAVFLLGLGLWAPRLAALTGTALTAVFFVLATAFWSTFILEDSVLTGIRKAVWVPAENALFGVAKIALLWPMSKVAPDLGVFLAWALPVFPIVIVVNLLIIGQTRRQGPVDASAEATSDELTSASSGLPSSAPASAADLGLRGLLAYSSADWLASVARLAATGIGPLLVLGLVGQAEAGYFNIAWLVAYTTFLLSINVSDAMLAESSFDLGDLNANIRQALLLSLALTLPIVVVGTLGAPFILTIFGQRFAENGSDLLRLLFLAALPNVAYQMFLGRLRSLGRMRTVILLEMILATVVLSVGTVALRRIGLAGIGLAWLIGLGSLGLVALVFETQWWWASRLDTRLVRSLGRRLSWVRRPRVSPEVERRLASTLAAGGIEAVAPPAWVSMSSDLLRAKVESEHQVHDILLSNRSQGVTLLDQTAGTLEELASDDRLNELRPLLPRAQRLVDPEEGLRLIISRPAGVTGEEFLNGSDRSADIGIDRSDFCERVVDALRPLHVATRELAVPSPDELAVWVDEPVAGIRARGRATNAELETVSRLLRAELEATGIALCHNHGRLTPGNVILGSDGDIVAIRGWRGAHRSPYGLDHATLALTAEAAARSEELGAVVRSALDNPDGILQGDLDWVDSSMPSLSKRGAILLAWLMLVGQDQPSGSAVLPNLFWASRNVQPVLAAVSGATEVS